jgi:SPP1 family predicted phage head-tail adaptor
MEKSLNPGNYRHRISFLQEKPGDDETGDPSGDWVVFKSAWASKDPILGNEFYNALSANTKVDVKFNSRYISGVTNTMRIQHGEKIHEILSAINVKSMNKELLCYCRLVV